MAKLSEDEARRIYNDSIVINGMVGTTYAFDVFEKTNQTAAVFTLAAHNEDWNRAMELFKNYMAALIAHHDKMLLVESVDDIIRAKKEHKFGMIFGFQTATPIGMDWTNLWIMYKLGLRIMQLTYMNRTACGDGCQEVTDMGLTRTFQNINLFKDLSVMDNVLVGLHCKTKCDPISAMLTLPNQRREEKKSREQVMETLAFLGLDHVANEKAGSLSYGMQKNLEIARAMVSHPKVILLDEPASGLNTSDLDSLSRRVVDIRNSGITVVLIEHKMDVVMTISDKIIVLNFGKKIADGTPDEVSHDQGVIEAYLGKDDD